MLQRVLNFSSINIPENFVSLHKFKGPKLLTKSVNFKKKDFDKILCSNILYNRLSKVFLCGFKNDRHHYQALFRE